MSIYGYDENLNYDKMGNINFLQRKTSTTLRDYLGFSYNGNQISSIYDYAGQINVYDIKEYNNNNTSGYGFQYDKNGNMTVDKDRKIVAIKYNLLNLPDVIQFSNGNQIKNRYSADGRKLGTEYFTQLTTIQPLAEGTILNQVYQANVVDQTGTAYVGNYEYKTYWNVPYYITLKKVFNSEGYVDEYSNNQSYSGYVYFRKDHLGNNREVWRAGKPGGASATTLQRTWYYPSGLPWSYNTGIGASVQPYKYNSKEFIEMHGFDTYDYGARGYYPALGRFMTIDPMAEKYYSISPYAHCLNNPVRFTDPDGREVDIEHRTGFLGLGKKEKLKYDNGNLYNKDGSAYTGKVNGFLKKTVSALGSLNQTKEGASMVTELQSSSNVFTIKSGAINQFRPDTPSKAGANLTEIQVATGNTVGSTGSGGTIFWNSSSTSGGFDLSRGTTRPAYISLGHELGHGSDANQGLLHFSSDYTNGATGVQYQSTYQGLLKSEWRAVYRENLIRGQAGVPLRTNYGIDMSTGVPLPAGPRLLDATNQPLNYP